MVKLAQLTSKIERRKRSLLNQELRTSDSKHNVSESISMHYKTIERTPTVQEYNAVRLAAGLSVKDELAAQQGLGNTLFGICVVRNEAVVGIGRVIGDGGLFYDIVDVAVVAEHQRKGVGKMIMDGLMGYIDINARPSSLVCLMANKGIAPFYEKYGFKARETDMPGMIIRR
jgi:GNAT superfamily N-acetyltransferase